MYCPPAHTVLGDIHIWSGRPKWGERFQAVAGAHPSGNIGVHFCGNPAIANDLETMCHKYSSLTEKRYFRFHKVRLRCDKLRSLFLFSLTLVLLWLVGKLLVDTPHLRELVVSSSVTTLVFFFPALPFSPLRKWLASVLCLSCASVFKKIQFTLTHIALATRMRPELRAGSEAQEEKRAKNGLFHDTTTLKLAKRRNAEK